MPLQKLYGMLLIDLLGLLEPDYHKAQFAHAIPLYGELHIVFFDADALDLLMEGDVDLAPLLLIELHVDVLQVQVHLIFQVSEAEEDLAISFPLSVSLMC